MLFSQAPRTVLIEDFSSATCGPCATTNPIFKAFLEQFGNSVISVAFQCHIPVTGDPMYAQNVPDVSSRVTYYGINSAPNCRVDGKVSAPGASSPAHPLNVTAAYLNNRLAVTSPIEMSVEHDIVFGTNGAKDSMNIKVSIKNVSSSDFSNANYVLQTAIIEKEIRFAKQAATNGEVEFHNVMRKMIPSATGTKITDVIAAGATKVISFKVPVPTYIYSYTELGVVAYVQNNLTSSKEVIQTGVSEPKAIQIPYADLSMESITVTDKTNNCDNNFGFEMSVKNNSTVGDTIKTIDFIPTIGGANKPKVTWTGTLLPGQTITHKALNQIATLGNAFVNITIDKINGGALKDLNLVNNTLTQQRIVTLNNTVAGTNIRQGFETPIATTAPPNTFFFNEGVRIFKQDSSFARNASGQDPPYGMGGYGASRYMVFFAFSDGGVAGNSSSVVFDKIDLTNSKSTKMTWNYAYAPKDGASTDKMEVLVSTNCGDTWTTVYSKQGDALKSCDPDLSLSFIPGFFLPDPSQWTTTSVDLSAYDGTPELMIRMKGTAGNGWAYFLDDVNVASVVATKDESSIKSIAITPNPATNFIDLSISSEENITATINLNDSNGKTVSSERKSLRTGVNNYTMSLNQTPGLYFVEVKTSKGVITKKVIII